MRFDKFAFSEFPQKSEHTLIHRALFSIQIDRNIRKSKILPINKITEAPSGAEANLLIHFAHLVNLRITICSSNFKLNFQIFERM